VWQPARGKVRLDGASLDQWSPDDLGRHIGYLPQDVELFDGSIGQNIARFQAEADPEAIIKAAEQAGVHDLIVSLAKGYESPSLKPAWRSQVGSGSVPAISGVCLRPSGARQRDGHSSGGSRQNKYTDPDILFSLRRDACPAAGGRIVLD